MYDTKSLQLTYILIITTGENMHVVEGEYVKPDTEYKKRFLDAYFGGGEYYYHDLEHYTVDELDTYIDLKYHELNEMNSMDDVDDKTGAGTANGAGFVRLSYNVCKHTLPVRSVFYIRYFWNYLYLHSGKRKFSGTFYSRGCRNRLIKSIYLQKCTVHDKLRTVHFSSILRFLNFSNNLTFS